MIAISYIIQALENITVCCSTTINSTFTELVTIVVLFSLAHEFALRQLSVTLTRVLSPSNSKTDVGLQVIYALTLD